MRLILHAGTHKTGTSTIQRVMYDNRERLRAHGVLYPDPVPWFGDTYDAHHPLVHAVARQDDDLAVARRMVAHIANDATGDDVVVLSAEPVYRHVLQSVQAGGWWRRHRQFLDALGRELAPFDVEAALVFRRRDAFIESIYHERAAQGYARPFDGLLDRADRLLDYERQVDLFDVVFSATHVLSYEDIAGPQIAETFLDAVGLPAPALETGAWERRSVDARLTLWMVAAYRDDRRPELVTQRRRFAKNPVSNRLFDDYGQVTLWVDRQARRELLDAYGDHAPIDDDRAPAILTPELEDRIDEAFDDYLVAKGLEPSGRRAGRGAAS